MSLCSNVNDEYACKILNMNAQGYLWKRV